MANERERDMVLAPNEYAYISDQTKGHIVTYVGPFKSSMANTDQPVIFDDNEKRFNRCTLEQAIQRFTVVPEGWYVVLKNPAHDGNQPVMGTSNNQTKLNVGRKVNLPGPTFFALWPGQMMRVILGHRLRSNQYLVVRVYEEEQAKKNWGKAVIQPQNPIIKTKTDNSPEGVITPISQEDASLELPNLSVGKMLIIKGSDVSFYIPPTGIEVVPDADGNYVRNAVTLEQLEYCILLDENGNKRIIKGPDVVIPKPTEKFYTKNGIRKFKAIELSEISGIYVKVISPYEENGKKLNVGDELFITGKDQMIYYPRIEHALIKYGEQEIYHAVAIPVGEGRYYLNRKTGQISLMKGPCMFLPDPREAVIVQRILTEKQAKFWYPGNTEVLDYNNRLKQLASGEKNEDFLTQTQLKGILEKKKEVATDKEKVSTEIAGDEFVRKQSYTKARTITLDTKYQGAVTVDVWTGYAVLVTGKSGTRKVIAGPQTYLLEYDEDLAVADLSTGTPKTDDKLIKTVYLRVLHNKVSDIVEVETKDLCPAQITLSYRVNFTGEPDKWFDVENYVKFLTDHMRSVIRNAIKKLTIVEFYSNGIDILRNVVLGKADESGQRKGSMFEENGMLIYDVEVLDIKLLDEEIETLLFQAQHDEMKQRLQVATKEHTLDYTKKIEDLDRKISDEKSQTVMKKIEQSILETNKKLESKLAENHAEGKVKLASLTSAMEEQKLNEKIIAGLLNQEKAKRDQDLYYSEKEMVNELKRLKAEVDAVVSKAQAVSPDLIAALQAFSDRALAEKVAQSMSPLSILGGKSVAEVFSNMLKGTSLEYVMKKALYNNEDVEEV